MMSFKVPEDSELRVHNTIPYHAHYTTQKKIANGALSPNQASPTKLVAVIATHHGFLPNGLPL
jgi:hypothetical protein